MPATMTSLQRVLATMQHQEPDRVPLFLLFTMHGAKETGLSIREYFTRPEYIAEGQKRLLRKYRGDCFYALLYAAAEAEAWGSPVIWKEDGPPNAGQPAIRTPEDIETIAVPVVEESPALARTLRVVELLKPAAKDEIPIVGAIMSPFSLPVMQMGFEAYLDLMYTDPGLFKKLMKKNTEFCIAWANALFDAGATALGYFDPLASPDMIPPDLYRKTGLKAARQVVKKARGPLAAHLASGRTLPVIGDLAAAGFAGVGFSSLDNTADVKEACRGRLTMLGNLNGIAMRNWTPAETERIVRETIATAGPGGGFILSDNHGEIPWQVPEHVLLAISDAARKHGTYPLG